MSLNALFPDPGSQTAATTIIGLISIFSAVLITMNQYVKSQQMMEAHRAAALAQGKLHRIIMNELALRRDQRQNALEFLKLVRTEQDRLENSSPSILPSVIKRFNTQFADRDIEKPEIAGDLDETTVNTSARRRKGGGESNYYQESPRPENRSPTQLLFPNVVHNALKAKMKPLLGATSSFMKKRVFPEPALPAALQRPVKTDESVPENIIIGGGESRPITPPRG